MLCRTVDKYVPVSATSDLLTEITPSYIPKLLNKNATRCVRLPLSPMYLCPPTKLPIGPLISMCRLKSRPHHPSPPQLDHLTSPRSTHIARARLTLPLCTRFCTRLLRCWTALPKPTPPDRTYQESALPRLQLMRTRLSTSLPPCNRLMWEHMWMHCMFCAKPVCAFLYHWSLWYYNKILMIIIKPVHVETIYTIVYHLHLNNNPFMNVVDQCSGWVPRGMFHCGSTTTLCDMVWYDNVLTNVK